MDKVVDKLPQAKVAEELYNELLQAYQGIYGGRSKQVLEHEIESLTKKGSSRAEAINKLAKKELTLGDVKNELLLNLPSSVVYEHLSDFIKKRMSGGIEFIDVKKTPPSHIEGKWFIGLKKMGGNFKVEITQYDDISNVKTNVSVVGPNKISLCCFFIGLFLLLAVPYAWTLWLMSFGFATAFFFTSQWRKYTILQEINEVLSNIPETTKIVEKDYKKITGKDEGEIIVTSETIEGFNVNLPTEDVFNQLVDYYGDFLKKKVPFSYIEVRWLGGLFKIDIVPKNGDSLIKVNISYLFMNLLALFFFIIFLFGLFMILNPSTYYSYYWGPVLGAGGVIWGILFLFRIRRMKRTDIERLKELFKI